MTKHFEVGSYAINNKSIGIEGPQSTIYEVVGRVVICGVEYVKLKQTLSSGKSRCFQRIIYFNLIQDEEYCYYRPAKGIGYISPAISMVMNNAKI